MVKASRLNSGYSAYISSAAGLTAARGDHQTPCENGWHTGHLLSKLKRRAA